MFTRLTAALGKRLGIDSQYLVHNGFWVTFRYVVTSLLGLATTVVFTRLMTPETYGTYQFIIALVAFFSFLSLPGLNMAALKAVVAGRDRGVIQAVRWSLLVGFFGTPCLLGYALYHESFGYQGIPFDVFVITAFSFPFFYAFNTWYVYYEGRKNFFAVMWRSLLISLVTFVALGVALMAKASLNTLLLLYFGVTILFSVVYVGEILYQIRKERNHSKPLDFKYGLGITGQKFVYGLTETFPVLVIGMLYGYHEVAFFQIAFFLFSSVSAYTGALMAMYLPHFFKGMALEGRRILTLNFLSGFLVVVAMALFLLLVFPWLYDETYSTSKTLAWYLLPVMFLLPLKNYLLSYFTTQAKSKFLISVYIGANILGLGAASALQESGILIVATVYLATLTLAITLPLLWYYFLYTKRLRKCV
ncbi:MAG: hypothetical protein E6R05_06640 [Candidatus Moraniibacteriota bacterium]|nr:MAG: hypothetical protein E6R05_06640 [Candidatus Moranbacteria bacterium]